MLFTTFTATFTFPLKVFRMSAPPLPDFSEAKLQKLRALAQQYEIKPELVGKLRVLDSFEIIVVCDDSGSSKQADDDLTLMRK